MAVAEAQRDPLVGRPEQHVETDAAGQQAPGIEICQPCQALAVVEPAGVEEVRRQATRLGPELAEAQHAGLYGKADELLGQRVGGRIHHEKLSCEPRHPVGRGRGARF
jgi:hypothetical protein